ncbi:MAG: gamma-glutamyl-gamma-aminobutyrate hydrolase family protein [Chloroflexia bacterium]|nr:gamma-glutamyl-gamma-aminobutyrate hydrolase family protein [Chloroflexia bacterium]
MPTTVLYIDTEHDQVVDDPVLGVPHLAKIEEARRRLEAAAGSPCRVVRFPDVSLATIAHAEAAAVVISGCTTDWAKYDFGALAGLLDVIRAAPVPVLGICAGHQLVGFAHGAAWGPLGPLADGEADPHPHFAPGERKERGFLPVEVDADCPLFRDVGTIGIFFQSHYWQLEATPPGFVARASSPWSAIQTIERLDRPVFGVQFHPERADDAHPDGAAVLRNFFALARRATRP